MDLAKRVLEAASEYEGRCGRRPTHVYATSDFFAALTMEVGALTVWGMEVVAVAAMPENACGKEFFVVA